MFRSGDTRICNKIWKHFYPSEGELGGTVGGKARQQGARFKQVLSVRSLESA